MSIDFKYNGIVIIIYSCFKNKVKSRQLYNLLKNNINKTIKILILNGDNNLQEECIIKNEYMIVKCKDNYDNLYKKTKHMLKEIINMFPNFTGILKIDDDIFPNTNVLNTHIKWLTNSYIDYCGKVSIISDEQSKIPNSHHIYKCEEKENKRPIFLPECTYCTGPCYYLSKRAIKYFNNNCKEHLSEDIMVGLTFKNSIIKPIVFPLYYNDKSFKWTSNIQNIKDNILDDYLTYIKLHGGLGNQLYQVACGIEYCNKNNSLPILIYNNDWCTHFNMKTSLNTIFKNFNSLSFDDFKEMDIKYNIIKPEKYFNDAYNYFLLPKIKGNVLLDGYFQNIKYFEESKDELYRIIIDEDYTDLIKKKYLNIENEYFIHIRRGDYINNIPYEIDYDNYYNSALKCLISSENKKINLNIISNDIEYCKSYEILNNFKEKINLNFIDNIDEIESFYIMTQCYGGIIANSSFSWWGAFINNQSYKKFILPSKWIKESKTIDMNFGKNILSI